MIHCWMKPFHCVAVCVAWFPASVLLGDACLAEQKQAGGSADGMIALTRLVGADAGLCIEFRNLAVHRQRIAKSELAQRFRRSALMPVVSKSSLFRKWRKIRKQVEAESEQPFASLVDGVFGESVVFAVYPRREDGSAGVLLTKASNRNALQEVLRVWNQAEPKTVLRKRVYRGVTYFARRRTEAGRRNGRTLYYVTLRDVFVLSDREDVVRDVVRLFRSADVKNAGGKKKAIERDVASDDEQSLAEVPAYQQACKTLSGNPLVTAFVNPRMWDRDEQTPNPVHAGKDPATRIWKCSRWMMSGLRLDDEALVFETVVQLAPAALPETVRETLQRLGGRPAFLDRVPDHALLAFAGRFDPVAVRASLQSGETTRNSRSDAQRLRRMGRAILQGMDVVDELLPRLKRNFGFYVVGTTTDPEPTRWPLNGLVAVELAAGGAGGKNAEKHWRTKLDKGLANALQFFVTAQNLKASPDDKLATVKSRNRDGLSVHWMHSFKSWQPALGVTSTYLVAAGTPGLIEDFHSRNTKRLVDDPRFQRWQKAYFADHQQLLYVNTARMHQHLQTYSGRLLRKLPSDQRGQPDRKRSSSRLVMEAFGLCDAAFLAVRVRESRLRLSGGLLVGGTTDE